MNDPEDYFISLWGSTPSMGPITHCVESLIQFKDITVVRKKFTREASKWTRYFYFGHPDFRNESGGFTTLEKLYFQVQKFYKEAVRRENYKQYLANK